MDDLVIVTVMLAGMPTTIQVSTQTRDQLAADGLLLEPPVAKPARPANKARTPATKKAATP